MQDDVKEVRFLRNGRVRVTLAGGSVLELSYASYRESGLREGEPVDSGQVETALARESEHGALEKAMDLLGRRVRSRVELGRSLRQRGFEPGATEYALDAAARAGLLDDRHFAECYARDRLRLKPRGAQRVVAELVGRGVDRCLAAEVVAAEVAAMDGGEIAVALESAHRWLRREQRASRRRSAPRRERLQRHLLSRGFPGAVVAAVLAALRQELCESAA
jgi:regulatory protein